MTIKPLSIADIRALTEGTIVAFNCRGDVIPARVLSDVKVKALRVQLVPHKTQRDRGVKSRRGQFEGFSFHVAIEYTDPRTGKVAAAHITDGLRKLLVKGA